MAVRVKRSMSVNVSVTIHDAVAGRSKVWQELCVCVCVKRKEKLIRK